MVEKKGKSKNTEPPVWEWILAAIGLVLVGAVIGTALYKAVIQEQSPPGFVASVESIAIVPNGYMVAFRLRNVGTQTAAGLQLEANLENAGQIVETSTVELAYVPGGSERSGGLFFSKDPNSHSIKIRVLGYENP